MAWNAARASSKPKVRSTTGFRPDEAMARFMLGMEHKHDGRRDKAKPLLQAALTGGLPAAEAVVATRALADL